MAIESSLTKGVRKTGKSTKSQLEWPSPDLSSTNSSSKYGSYQGDSDSEATSFTSSMHGSTSSATSSVDQYRSCIEGGTGRNKTLSKLNAKKPTSFRSFGPSRRRPQSRLSQPSMNLPDDGSATPCHPSSVEVADASPNYFEKPVQKFTRTGSLRTLRILRKKNRSSSESRKSSTVEEMRSERATFSSILKDSKFPKQLKPQVGAKESEEVLRVAKFCPYQHCSLHGHHHHHEPPLKRFAFLKRRSSKDQKSINPQSQTTLTKKRSAKKSEDKVTQNVSAEEPAILDDGKCSNNKNAIGDNKDDVDFSIEFYAKTRSERLIEASCGHDDADLADILFGVNRFQDNQNEVGNLHMEDHDSSVINTDMKSKEIPVSNLQVSIATKGEKNENSDWCTCVEAKIPAFNKSNHMSMWHMIHRHMVSGLVAEPGSRLHQQVDEEKRSRIEDASNSSETEDFNDVTENDDAVNQENEIRKMFAIKIVREAIEQILLPEVQDNQSTTSEVISEQDVSGKNQTAGEVASVPASRDDPEEPTQAANDMSGQGEKAEETVTTQTEERKPNSWSHLKKVILLRRFIKELQKVKKSNPDKPRHVPLVPETEAETVSLRHQTIGEKKKSDEWMLDYALQQVVGELAPTQKRKVALLVKAFETVAPPQEDQPSEVKIPKLDDCPAKESSLTAELQMVSSDAKGDYKEFCEAGVEICDNKRNSKTDSATKLKGRSITVSSSAVDLSEHLTRAKEDMKKNLKLDFGAKVARGNQFDQEKHIKMWHMIYRHVVTDVATKVGSELLLGGDESVHEEERNMKEVEDQNISNCRHKFSQSDADKLVRESVDEILLPKVHNDTSLDTQSIADDDITSDQELVAKNEGGREESQKMEKDFAVDEARKKTNEAATLTFKNRLEQETSNNWRKLKKLILLRRSIKALESFRKLKPQTPEQSVFTGEPEGERVDLKSQMIDEKKKAEQWMLDYAVQHIVTKLTPARKKRVSLLVEAFEAVIPLPEI